MPTVQCPYCLQKIEAPLEQLAGEVYCRGCSTWFAPLDDGPPEADGPWEEEPEYREPAYAEPLYLAAPDLEAPEPPADPWPGSAAVEPEPDVPRERPTHCIRCGERLHNVLACPRCDVWVCCELCLQKHLAGCAAATEPARPGCSPQVIAVAVACVVVLALCTGLANVISPGKPKPASGGQPVANPRAPLPRDLPPVQHARDDDQPPPAFESPADAHERISRAAIKATLPPGSKKR
jgi:hypothetical protein